MNDPLEIHLLSLCRILAKHQVEYLIVGGAAVGIYGHYRMTVLQSGLVSDKYDFDFWYNPSYANYYRLLDALEEIGVNVASFRREQTPNPKKSFFKHSFDDFTIDFLPEILGLGRFGDAFRNKSVSSVDGFDIYTVSLADLIQSKQATNRLKDQEDIAMLKALHNIP